MNTVAFCLFAVVSSLSVETTFSLRSRWRRFQDGYFVIGALFPITEGPRCDIVREEGLVLVEAFVHTVNAKNNESIFPGGSIGYDIRDTCSIPAVALRELLDILGKSEGSSWKNCTLSRAGNSCGVIAVVGPQSSKSALAISPLLSMYGVPQVREIFSFVIKMSALQCSKFGCSDKTLELLEGIVSQSFFL